MLEYIKGISLAEIIVYAVGGGIWFSLICWLYEEELEAKRQERFAKSEVRCHEK